MVVWGNKKLKWKSEKAKFSSVIIETCITIFPVELKHSKLIG